MELEPQKPFSKLVCRMQNSSAKPEQLNRRSEQTKSMIQVIGSMVKFFECLNSLCDKLFRGNDN